ncbi:MAG: hypothetical protein KC910_25610 [Candidatus Eremiobacteraeota bacterium]|nr:hypothetical protein [Candidatus Eremiobacteraeota bacterium]
MTVKQSVLKMIEALPDDASFESIQEALERTRFLTDVQAGLDDIERGDTVPHQEVKRMIAEWKNSR